MRIHTLRRESNDGRTRLSAFVDDFQIWIDVAGDRALSERGDPFVPAALLAAMVRGEDLEIDAGIPVSPRLVENTTAAQALLPAFDPRFRRVAVHALSTAAAPAGTEVISLYSGGVDGTYTALTCPDATHLILLRGFELSVDHPALDAAVARAGRFAARFGRTIVVMSTNLKAFAYHHGLSMEKHFHGALLAGIALAFGARRTYVASSFSVNNLFPWGSHPLLDPLWSTEGTSIVHHAIEVSRVDKLRWLGDQPGGLDYLRVCAKGHHHNCGACEKCLRTMVVLRLIGRTSPAFPPLTSMDPVKRLRIHNPVQRVFVEQNYALAKSVGDEEVMEALGRLLRRHTARTLAGRIEGAVFGGALRRWRLSRTEGAAEHAAVLAPSQPAAPAGAAKAVAAPPRPLGDPSRG